MLHHRSYSARSEESPPRGHNGPRLESKGTTNTGSNKENPRGHKAPRMMNVNYSDTWILRVGTRKPSRLQIVPSHTFLHHPFP